MGKRLTLVIIAVLATAGLTLGNAGTAAARPVPAATWAVNGDHFWVRTPQCAGDVRVALTTDTARPGTVTAKFIPSRFTRTCTFYVWAGWGWMLPDQIRVKMTSGPRGGKPVVRTYRTGPGLALMGFGHRPSLSSISMYTLVP